MSILVKQAYRLAMACLTLGFFYWGGPTVDPLALAQTARSAARPDFLVDVNSADQKTLETLPGIGPALAERIVAGRPYNKLEDLERVKGIGKVTLAALRERVTFGQPPGVARVTTNIPSGASGVKTARSSLERPRATAPSKQPISSPAKVKAGERININKATAEQLQRLPGIGPAKADAITQYRVQNGLFKSIEDIQKVKGIKAGAFSKLKDYIKVTD